MKINLSTIQQFIFRLNPFNLNRRTKYELLVGLFLMGFLDKTFCRGSQCFGMTWSIPSLIKFLDDRNGGPSNSTKEDVIILRLVAFCEYRFYNIKFFRDDMYGSCFSISPRFL